MYTAETINFYKNAGKNIRLFRKMRGISCDLLALETGISPKFIYEIENGKKGFSADSLYKIATSLNVNCDEILRE